MHSASRLYSPGLALWQRLMDYRQGAVISYDFDSIFPIRLYLSCLVPKIWISQMQLLKLEPFEPV